MKHLKNTVKNKRKVGRPAKPINWALVKEMRNNYKRMGEIAEVVGLSQSRLGVRMKEKGIK